VFLELLKWLKRPEQRSAEFLLLNVIIGDVVNAINTLFIRRQTYLYVNDMFYVYVCVCVFWPIHLAMCRLAVKVSLSLDQNHAVVANNFSQNTRINKSEKCKSSERKTERERDGKCERDRQSPL